MIQRLLRGRLFYVCFGALVALLYIRAMGVGSVAPADLNRPLPDSEIPAWWTESSDVSILQQAAQSGGHIGVMLVVLSLLVCALSAGGIILAGWALWTGRIRSIWRFPTIHRPGWSFGELCRITFLAVAIAFLLPFVRVALLFYQPLWTLDPNLWITVSMLLLDLLVVIAILAFAEGKGRSPWALFGFSRRVVWRSVKTGLLGYTTLFPWLFVLLFLIVELSNALGFKPPLEPIHKLLFEEHRTAVLILTGVLACAVAPTAEEFFFRGVVYSAIRRRTSRLTAMVISGALFAMIHTNLIGFLPIFLLGCLLAYLYERTGSLITPITVHVLHNALLLGLAMVFRQFVPFS